MKQWMYQVHKNLRFQRNIDSFKSTLLQYTVYANIKQLIKYCIANGQLNIAAGSNYLQWLCVAQTSPQKIHQQIKLFVVDTIQAQEWRYRA